MGGKIIASCFVPAGAYFLVIPCLVAGTSKEMRLRTRNLRYRHGVLDGFNFDPKLTPMEEF